MVFAVKNRQAFFQEHQQKEVFRYIAGVLNQTGHYADAVNGHQDHIHIFFDYNGKEHVENLVREIKKASNHLINEKEFIPFRFECQIGYGVFSNAYRENDQIINYIKNQKQYHQKRIFRKEYLDLL